MLFSLIKYTRITYEDYVYPPWGEAVGWVITVASMLCVPLLIIKTVVDIYWRENDGGSTSQVAVRFNIHELLAFDQYSNFGQNCRDTSPNYHSFRVPKLIASTPLHFNFDNVVTL